MTRLKRAIGAALLALLVVGCGNSQPLANSAQDANGTATATVSEQSPSAAASVSADSTQPLAPQPTVAASRSSAAAPEQQAGIAPQPSADPDQQPAVLTRSMADLSLAFELPTAAYRLHADKRDPIKKVVHLGFERDNVYDANGHAVRPYCGITGEEVSGNPGIVEYSLSWRLRVPFKVDEVFSHNDGSLTLKNAIGYRGHISYNGDEHTLLVVHALHGKRGFVVVCDSTTSVYPQVKGEFAALLKSLHHTDTP